MFLKQSYLNCLSQASYMITEEEWFPFKTDSRVMRSHRS